MALSDTAIRNAKPQAKPFKVFDAGGLFLIATPAGGKWWRLRYTMDGKEKLLSLGTYPDTSLAAARERRDKARRLLAEGIDPGQQRKADKAKTRQLAENSFEQIARNWHAMMAANKWTEGNAVKVLRRLEKDVFPWIGARPITELEAPDVLMTVRRIARRSLETAHKAKDSIGQIFRYAIAEGNAARNPVPDLRDALPTVKNQHMAAPTTPEKTGELHGLWNGRQSTSTRPNGAISSPRHRPSTSCRFPGKRWR